MTREIRTYFELNENKAQNVKICRMLRGKFTALNAILEKKKV